MRRAVRHMWTVSDATEMAAAIARMPSHSAWLAARAKRNAAPMLMATASAMPQWTAGTSSRRPLFLQIGEADGDDEEGFEAFAERDDERLNHVSASARSTKRDSISR